MFDPALVIIVAVNAVVVAILITAWRSSRHPKVIARLIQYPGGTFGVVNRADFSQFTDIELQLVHATVNDWARGVRGAVRAYKEEHSVGRKSN